VEDRSSTLNNEFISEFAQHTQFGAMRHALSDGAKKVVVLVRCP